MSKQIDYSRDFLAFYRDLFVVEGAYGPQPVIPPFLAEWISIAFPAPDGNPAARNILDGRTKKQGKSALAAAVALYTASRQRYAEVPIVAADQDQGRDRVLRAVKFAVENGPLASHAKVYRDVVELDNRSIIQAYANDWRGAAGGNYAAVVFDELHTYTQESQRRLFDEMITPATQPHGVRWVSSYAGFTGESLLLYDWWNMGLSGKRINNDLPIYFNEAASLLAFIDVGETSWRMPWASAEYMQQVKTSERPNTYRRLWLNNWVSNESQFLPEGAWAACHSLDVKPLQPGERMRLVLGADASTSSDTTSLVGTVYSQATKTTDVRFVRVWKPTKSFLRMGKPTIDLTETIGAEVLKLHAAGCIDCVVYDTFQLHAIAMDWQKLGIKTIELPQTGARIEADQSLYNAVIAQTVRHYNDPTLNEHMHNAVARETPRGFRLDKSKTSLKIDAAVALSMSHWGAVEQQARGGSVSVEPNPFYDAAETIIPVATKHAEGVHWWNCTRRATGCLACEAELNAPGGENERLRELDRSLGVGR
jgi:hypothetical protein